MSEASKVDQALGRFEKALHQLETSLVKVHEKGSQLATSKGEAEALRAEREKLVKELDAVRAKAEDLADVNRQAVKRVDHAMVRIRKVLN